MTILRAPYRLVSLSDGGELVIQPASYEVGEAINPHGFQRAGATMPMLRVYPLSSARAHPRQYWDFTSGRLIAELPALLDEFAGSGARVRIRAAGAPPRVEYTVSVERA